MTYDVAALFIDPQGPYPKMPGVDCWDEARDARLYTGPYPVVAHPPCARWCRLAKQIEWRGQAKVGDDGGCFASALASVRKYGGVLEHPAFSLAWSAYDLLKPPAFGWAKAFNGDWVCEVAQSAYDHECEKLTWLLLVGCDPPHETNWSRPAGTKVITSYSRKSDGSIERRNADRVKGRGNIHTPQPFADFLVGLARQCNGPKTKPGPA